MGVDRLAGYLSHRDPSFTYDIIDLSGRLHLVVYSASSSQAKARGKWLTTKTQLLPGRAYAITLNAPRPQIKAARSIQEIEEEAKG